MKRFWTSIPLLLLITVGLLLPAGGMAQARKLTAVAVLNTNDVISEVNALRVASGLAPYKVNTILMAVAQSHAEYQASTGVLTHYSVDGSRPYQRALAAGYSVAGDLSRGGFFSENIHSGLNLSAAQAVEDWQGDSLHLNTMISPDLQDVGVGIAVADGVTYYTLDAGLASDVVTPVSTSSTSGAVGDPFSSSTGTPSTSQPVTISTASEDGSVYHVIQANEALWSIALAYNITVDELKRNNGLATDDIFIGQTLLISKKEVETPTAEPSITATFGIPTSTATRPITPSPTSTATPIPAPPASRQSGSMVVGGIILIALFGAGLGAWLGRRRSA